jgi:hypothetical protein
MPQNPHPLLLGCMFWFLVAAREPAQQQVEPGSQGLTQIEPWLVVDQPAAEGVEVDGSHDLSRRLRVHRCGDLASVPALAKDPEHGLGDGLRNDPLVPELPGEPSFLLVDVRERVHHAAEPFPGWFGRCLLQGRQLIPSADMFLERKDDDTLSRLAAVPLERLGTPADIAPAVAFLASPSGHWINGQTIRVNGGLV